MFSYLTPLHRFDYTLIPYRFFMLLTDWYFIRALWKMNIKIILSEYCHVLVILYAILAVLFLSSIMLSIEIWPIYKVNFFIHRTLWKLYDFVCCCKNSCVCLRVNLRKSHEIVRLSPSTRHEMFDIVATRLQFDEIPRGIIGDSFRAIYSWIVFRNKLYVVASDRRMQALSDGARSLHNIYKRPTIWSATSSSRTRHLTFLSLSHTYACMYILSQNSDYYPENDKYWRDEIYCNEQFCVRQESSCEE